MTKDEALKLALEALGHFEKAGLATLKTIDAITTIREALALSESSTKCEETSHAQPEQEPVACVGTNGELMWLNKSKVIYSKPIPLYTTPPQRKPLSDEEIDVLVMDSDGTPNSHLEFARAIEAAHGIKEWAAVRAEREAIAQSLDKQADLAADDIDRQWAMEMAKAVRSRSNK